MKNKQKTKEKIMNDEDYIYCPRLSNSLKNLVDKNPNGIDDDRIKKVLLIDQEELDKWYNSALEKIRKYLNLQE